MENLGRVLYAVLCVCVAMIGYEMHGSVGWAIVDLIFTPVVLIYWLVTQQINLSLLQETFSFFFK